MTMTALPPARRREPRETNEVADGARRMIRAVGRRAAYDVDALPLLADLAREVEETLAAAARACHDPKAEGTCSWSWADIGRVLGISKQAAQQRFARPDGQDPT